MSTAATYILGLAITILTSGLSEGSAIIPTHTALPHHPHKLGTITNHIGVKCLAKGLHAKKGPVSSHVPLSAPNVGVKLKPSEINLKSLTSPISAISRKSPLNVRSTDVKTNSERVAYPQSMQIKNGTDPEKNTSAAVTNTTRIDNIFISKNISSGFNESMDTLNYLNAAANPVDLSESNIRILTKNNGEEIEYRLPETNVTNWSDFSQNLTKILNNQSTLLPFKIMTLNSSDNNYESEIKPSAISAGDKMDNYLKVMNVSRNFQNYNSNQSRPLRNILDDFQRSLSQSLLWQNDKSSSLRNNNYQNPIINLDGNLNRDDNYQRNSNPADRIWNSATNFAGNVAEKALDLAGNFVNAALSSENFKNGPNSEDRFGFSQRNGYPPVQKSQQVSRNGYPPEQRSQPVPQNVYPPEQRSQPAPQNVYPPEQRSQPVPQNVYPPEQRSQPVPQNVYPPEQRSRPPPPIGFSNVQNGAASNFYNNRDLPYQSSYPGNYYQENNPSGVVWNPAIDLGQKIEYTSPGIYYLKQSEPVELLLNPSNQYSISRRYRQMPTAESNGLPVLGQTPATNNQGMNSAGAIVNSALSLARSIVGGDYEKIVQSSINMGKGIQDAASTNQAVTSQFLKQPNPYGSLFNLGSVRNVALNLKNDGNDKSEEIVSDSDKNLVADIDAFLTNSSNVGNSRTAAVKSQDQYIDQSKPIESIEKADNSESGQTLRTLNKNGPYSTETFWNFVNPVLSANTGNTAINPRLVGISQILQSPYGSGTYLGTVPLRTLYNPLPNVGDVSNIHLNPTQLGTTYLYV